MSVLKETTADGLKVLRAATAATDVMRKGEVDALLAARPTTAEMTVALAAVTHEAVTAQNSTSLALSVSGQELIGSVRLATDSGLRIDPDGLTVDFGTGAAQVAAGNHTHDNDHIAATGGSTSSAVVTVSAEQAVSVAVTTDPFGNIQVGSAGLKIADSAFAAYGHTHALASAIAPGFMSAADKLALDAMASPIYAYRLYAENVVGSSVQNPSETPSAGMLWEATLLTETPHANPTVADFAGLWQLRLGAQAAPISSSNGTLAATTVLANQLRAAMIALGLLPAD